MMGKLWSVVAAFFVMLALGGIYAWSIISEQLILNYNWTTTQTQLVFGMVIAVFPTTMIFAGRAYHRVSPRIFIILSALLFLAGYVLAWQSKGGFYPILLGIGLLVGISTGLGYLMGVTIPVKWFPQKKGLVTGISAAGFGLSAVLVTLIVEYFLNQGKTILTIF
jgi:MFS transporter, OFA family, oxalate/formate antiporter